MQHYYNKGYNIAHKTVLEDINALIDGAVI